MRMALDPSIIGLFGKKEVALALFADADVPYARIARLIGAGYSTVLRWAHEERPIRIKGVSTLELIDVCVKRGWSRPEEADLDLG